jgi:hypothetical protein
MGTSDATQIPKLSADGSNFKKWKAAIDIYTRMLDAEDVLNGTMPMPKAPHYWGLIPKHKPINVTTIKEDVSEHAAKMNRIKIYNEGREAINKPIIKKANNMAGLRRA